MSPRKSVGVPGNTQAAGRQALIGSLNQRKHGNTYEGGCVPQLHLLSSVQRGQVVYSVQSPHAFAAKERCCAGAERIYDLGDLTDYEKAGLELLKPELKASIDKARRPMLSLCIFHTLYMCIFCSAHELLLSKSCRVFWALLRSRTLLQA